MNGVWFNWAIPFATKCGLVLFSRNCGTPIFWAREVSLFLYVWLRTSGVPLLLLILLLISA